MSARLFRIEDWEKLAKEEEFKPGNLAVRSGITPRHLQRLFKKDLGSTPTDWLRRFRCRLAVELIRKGYSNKAVVTELKFGGPSHLCHEFQRVYGASPQSFAPASRDVANGQ